MKETRNVRDDGQPKDVKDLNERREESNDVEAQAIGVVNGTTDEKTEKDE